MEAVRWGVLGVSDHFTRRVALPVRGSEAAALSAIASRSSARAKEAASRLGVARSYGSYQELLQDPEIEAVYIPLPNHLHAEWIRRAADAGKHILCEKPLAMNAREAEEAAAYTAGAGVRLMEAFMYRFQPQWRRAWELIRAGEIGDVRAVHTHYAYNLQDPNNIRNRLEAGGGAIMDIGCYAVSAPRFILEAEPVRVISLVERDERFKTDRLSSAILDFGEGRRSVLTVATQAFPAQRVDILGTAGRMTVWIPFNAFPDSPMRLSIWTSVGEREPQLPAVDQYRLMFEAFSKALREGKPVPTPPEDAVSNMKVLDALFRSEKSGKWEAV